MPDLQPRQYRSAEEKADFVIYCMSSNQSIAECCRQKNIGQGLYYLWRQRFLKAGTDGLRRKTKSPKAKTKVPKAPRHEHQLAEIKTQYARLLYSVSSKKGHLSTDLKMAVIDAVTSSEIANNKILDALDISPKTYYRWIRRLKDTGSLELQVKTPSTKLVDQEHVKQTIFKVLHSPPKKYGFNRTSWVYEELQKAIKKEGVQVGQHNIRAIIRNAGYRWLRAKKVLTSNDPDYRSKLDRIHKVLGNLKPTEAFFSIDEYGPFAVKQRQGKKLIPSGQSFSVPQWQESKGCLTMIAALELSTNQVTHFYSQKKDTEEMLKLLDILLEQYKSMDRIFLSWDAASWHMSKKLLQKIDDVNERADVDNGTKVKTVALPAGAQFLNVIESVFSGMSRAVIHNSDYKSVAETKKAINRYFEERNLHFKANPKRAGDKIWGKERTASIFSEGQNCKDPRYR